jgi:hypothetical protein
MTSRFQRLERYSDLFAVLAALVLLAALTVRSPPAQPGPDWRAHSGAIVTGLKA